MKEWPNKIHCGDALEILKKMPDDFVDCIITSPPYWGLRDYGQETRKIWDGDVNCEHDWNSTTYTIGNKAGNKDKSLWVAGKPRNNIRESNKARTQTTQFCRKCGAWYGQLGLEPSLDLYINHLLQITDELKRMLKKTGILFWNHGDCYGGKCLILQNWRLIIKMIDEQDWILRNVMIWYKPNYLPCSIKDRLTNTYEPVFMLVKNKNYYFNLDAIREPWKHNSIARLKYPIAILGNEKDRCPSLSGKRVLLNPDKYVSETEEIARKYGYDPNGICPICGRTWKRHASPNSIDRKAGLRRELIPCVRRENSNPKGMKLLARYPEKLVERMIKCGCPVNGIILDHFMGSGTTAVVAKKLGRNYIGIELNSEYVSMAEEWLKSVQSNFQYSLIEEENNEEVL